MKHIRGIIGFGLLALLTLLEVRPAIAETETPAWEQPRELGRFQSLLARTPFALPTAEESSPLAERFSMTGIVTIDGQEEVFVFDNSDQSRELLGKNPNAKNMALITLVREGGTPVKATIRVGGETGTIGFKESAQPKGPAPAAFNPAQPPQAPVTLPSRPPLPQQPAAPPNTRRIIRRPVVTAPQSPQQQQPHP